MLAAWSGFFAYLWLSGKVLLYLGPRTSWVVTFGAITLSATTVAYSALSSGDGERGVSRGEALGLASMLAPILVVMMLSNASLGALAASQKLSARGVDLDSLAEALAKDAAPLTFVEVKAASDSPEEAAKLDIRPGQQVSLTGFVMQAADSASGEFHLGRFYITCCVADAIPVWVPIYPTIAKGEFSKDTWLTVNGAIAERNGKLVVDAEQIERISQPSQPYLPWPTSAAS